MRRLFIIINFLLYLFASCSGSGERAEQQWQRVERTRALRPNVENRMPSVDYFTPSFYNIELIEQDTLHPVMQITYVSRRPSKTEFRWVDAVLRMDITPEQSMQLRELLYEEWQP